MSPAKPARKRTAAPLAEAAPLKAYAAKRSFGATPEPGPDAVAARAGPLLFCVQMHRARRLHYDLRFELDGVMKSFAVPKGLMIAPGERHLAVPTEDHPLDYSRFEGVIPAGQYGAGNVIVWDCGWYTPDEDGRLDLDDRASAEARLREAFAAGKLSITFFGVKLKGSYALVRMKDGSWLALKHRDVPPIPPPPAESLPLSVLSDEAVESLGRTGMLTPTSLEALAPHGPHETIPTKLAPMLAGSSEAFSDPAWLFEPKLDGWRVLAIVTADRVVLRSRRGQDLTAAFPAVARALLAQPARPFVADGEIVVFEDGTPSFGALQRRAGRVTPTEAEAAERRTPAVLFAFDLLHVKGINLRGSPFADRRRYLAQCMVPSTHLQLVHASPDGEALYRAALAAGFEGMMAKRRSGIYKPGARSDDWLKVKATRTADFVVGGYTKGKGSRRDRFGALSLGYFEDGRLVYVGDVGSGFDDSTLDALGTKLATLVEKRSPFDPVPKVPGVTWVRPEQVVEVQFADWTDSRNLRAPVFLRTRDDRDAERIGSPDERSHASHAPGAEAQTALIAQKLAALGASGTLEAGGAAIKLTHLDKELWPATAVSAPVTKRDLLSYLLAVSPYMLEHLRDRPLTVIRLPDGIEGESFFQKNWAGQRLPEFVETIDAGDGGGPRLACNNLPTLLWLAQMGSLEFHPWHSRASAEGIPKGVDARNAGAQLARPDYIVFDLDPDKRMVPKWPAAKPKRGAAPPADPAFALARAMALELRKLLEAMALVPFVKTTGHSGLHVYVPIERAIDADGARELCRLIGQHLLGAHPRELTMEPTPARRPPGRIFFDHNMNGRERTLAGAYSPRATPGAPVSMPLTWDALARAEPGEFRVGTVAGIIERIGTPWRGMLAARRNLAQALRAES